MDHRFNPSQLNSKLLPKQRKDSSYLKAIGPKLHLKDVDFSINAIKWSPDGSVIAIEHQT